jgi:hypothetical protein
MSTPPETSDNQPGHVPDSATPTISSQPQPNVVNLQEEVRIANANRTRQLNTLDETDTRGSSELNDLAASGQQLHPDATCRSRSRTRHRDHSRSPRAGKRARSHYTRRASFHQPQQLLSQSAGNYVPWSAYMKLALSDDVLWLNVLENKYSPEDLCLEGLDEPDRIVRKHIMLSVEMGEISAIAGAKTAYDMWNILREKYEGAVDPVIAKREFYGTTIRDRDTVKQHIDQMMILRAKMDRSGTPVSDSEFLTTLKHSLLNPNRRMLRGDVKRSEHTTVEKFVTYILSMEDEPIIPTKKQQPTNQAGGSKEKLEANTNAKTPDQSCSNCKRGNHTVENCRHEGGPQERHCSHCGKYGHLVEKCWKKGDDSRSNVPKSITQSAQVAKLIAPKDGEVDSKTIMDEIKQFREEVKRHNTQYGNSLFAETTRALMMSHLPAQSNSSQGQRGVTFVCDSGATSHMVNDAALFTSFVGCDVEVRTANEQSSLRATAIGTVHLRAPDDSSETPLSLRRALYVPGLSANLLSVRRLHLDGYTLQFKPDSVSLIWDNETVATGMILDGLYVFLLCRPFEELASLSINSRPPSKRTTWDFLHRAAGHVNVKTIRAALRNGRVKQMDVERTSPKDCTSCAISKMPAGKFEARDRVQSGWRLGIR